MNRHHYDKLEKEIKKDINVDFAILLTGWVLIASFALMDSPTQFYAIPIVFLLIGSFSLALMNFELRALKRERLRTIFEEQEK